MRTGERRYVVVVDSEDKSRLYYLPDCLRPSGKGSATPTESTGDVEPMTRRAFLEMEHREPFVEIHESNSERRLVTCVEVLSPSNKHPNTPGWDLYQRKRQSRNRGADQR